MGPNISNNDYVNYVEAKNIVYNIYCLKKFTIRVMNNG